MDYKKPILAIDGLLTRVAKRSHALMTGVGLILFVMVALLDKITGPDLAFSIFYLLPITFSVGAVTYEKAPIGADELICQADKLMYQVKKTGKNRVQYEVVSDLTKVGTG